MEITETNEVKCVEPIDGGASLIAAVDTILGEFDPSLDFNSERFGNIALQRNLTTAF